MRVTIVDRNTRGPGGILGGFSPENWTRKWMFYGVRGDINQVKISKLIIIIVCMCVVYKQDCVQGWNILKPLSCPSQGAILVRPQPHIESNIQDLTPEDSKCT